jgi:hypothetical protein
MTLMPSDPQKNEFAVASLAEVAGLEEGHELKNVRKSL